MYQSISSVALCGIDGVRIRVEADVRNGLPSFEMVGYLSGQVKEAGERVRSALYNSGYFLEPRRVLINLSPANVKKEGNAFDLPIAVAILCSIVSIPEEVLRETVFVGELSLNGQVRRIQGALPVACAAREAGMRFLFVPEENREEAAVVSGMEIIGVRTLRETVEYLTGARPAPVFAAVRRDPKQKEAGPDFAEVGGQRSAKRAAEVAAAGRHNLLFLGSAGSGKTMLARRIPGILPPLSAEESLEVSKIYSVAGLLDEKETMVWERPFRSPHHSIPRTAMSGGGRIPRAGEISLAHHGVLFLDELPEFSRDTLEVLRQPMEEHAITLSRLYATVTYPADFLLVAAMNLCRCGHYPDRNRCRCDEAQVQRYLSRLSGPLLDRMDLFAVTEPVAFSDLTGSEEREPSARIRERIGRVWQIQRERFRSEGIRFNSQMSGGQAERFCELDRDGRRLVEEAFSKLGISARVYHKLLKLARTIADLSGEEHISELHLCEAIQYRSAASRFWN